MIVLNNPTISNLCLHHTAVSRSKQPLQTDPVNRYHRDKWGMVSSLGWYGGYNFICDVNGIITQYRAIGEETIANVGHNCDVASRCDTVSFCFAGDFNQELPSDKQLAAFHKWYADFSELYTVTVVGHRDLQNNRTCPGILMTKDYIVHRLLRFGIEDEPLEQLTHSQKRDLLRAALRRIAVLLSRRLSTGS